MRTAMRVLRGLCITLGVLLVVLGLVAAAYGGIRMSFLAETTGIVTEGLTLPHSKTSDSRAMFYRYTVDGTNYSGMARLQLRDLQDGAGRLNRTIRIFYKKGHPAISYAVYRPSLLRWLRLSALLAVIGILAIFLAQKRQHLTTRWS
jgi:hypothetical protein